MGMPGFSGFVAELQVLIGAWKAFPTFAVLGGLGVLIGVAYTLRAVQKSFFSGHAEPSSELRDGTPNHDLEPISLPEKIGAALLIVCMVVIGVYPQLLLKLIVPALRSDLMAPLLKGGL
jgi:NADH-quinone oxidoreductase subunit M